MLNLVFSIAFVFVLIYLTLFFRFTRRFPKLYPELWKSLDCPESFGLRGQSTYLAIVLGLERKAPLRNLEEVRKEVAAIRIALAITLVAFIAVAIMTS
jgi:hypothetical protein